MRSCRATANNSYLVPVGKGKKSWTIQEDEKLRDLILAHGTLNWSLVSQCMLEPGQALDAGRSGKQCRERWHNHLNPTISKVEWTTQEDATILYLQKQWGNQWAKIAKYCPGRSDNAIKNRFHATCRNRNLAHVDLSDLNLPLFVEDAEPVVESSERPHSVSTCTTKADEEDYYEDEAELDFDAHVSKIKNYTSSLAQSPQPDDVHSLRDDIATSPLTNASMSIGSLAFDEMMDDGEADADHQTGMGGGINIEPVNFTSYKWGSQEYSEGEVSSSGCYGGLNNGNGFCSMGGMAGMVPTIQPVAFSSSMTAFCDFNAGNMGMGSQDQHDHYNDESNYGEPALMCDVVGPADDMMYEHEQPTQQMGGFFSPSSVFCAPRH